MEIIQAFLTFTNIAIFLATGALMATVRQCVPAVDQHPLWARVQPLAPLAIAVGLIFIPGASDVPHWGGKLIVGIAIGGMVNVGYKTVLQTFLGRDNRINPPQPPAPAAEQKAAP